jgi:O-acetyl-ADP-ribose deacetylase (regulator of RNase III)
MNLLEERGYWIDKRFLGVKFLEIILENVKFKLVQGNITKETTDIIVNAANPSLRGGGGVDGAIHRAGGSAILKECIEKYPDGCNTGEARITTAGLMNAKWVIHTPGPIWRGGHQQEEILLENSYRNSILLADEYGAKSIAFPSISTGVYGFPIEKASKTAIQTVLNTIRSTSIEEVHFVLFSSSDFEVYEEALKKF